MLDNVAAKPTILIIMKIMIIVNILSSTSIFLIITLVFKVHTHKSAAMLDNLAYVAAKPTILISHSLHLAKAGKYVFAYHDNNDEEEGNDISFVMLVMMMRRLWMMTILLSRLSSGV